MNQPDDLLLSIDLDSAYAEKSALPVAARDVSSEILLLQTAPLCPTINTQSMFSQVSLEVQKQGSPGSPRKVPTQSPSQLRSMGFPSLQAEMRRKEPSSNLFKEGRVGSGFPSSTEKEKGKRGKKGKVSGRAFT
jgi:hypothetical protein